MKTISTLKKKYFRKKNLNSYSPYSFYCNTFYLVIFNNILVLGNFIINIFSKILKSHLPNKKIKIVFSIMLIAPVFHKTK